MVHSVETCRILVRKNHRRRSTNRSWRISCMRAKRTSSWHEWAGTWLPVSRLTWRWALRRHRCQTHSCRSLAHVSETSPLSRLCVSIKKVVKKTVKKIVKKSCKCTRSQTAAVTRLSYLTVKCTKSHRGLSSRWIRSRSARTPLRCQRRPSARRPTNAASLAPPSVAGAAWSSVAASRSCRFRRRRAAGCENMKRHKNIPPAA